jgi:hypothetical protein
MDIEIPVEAEATRSRLGTGMSAAFSRLLRFEDAPPGRATLSRERGFVPEIYGRVHSARSTFAFVPGCPPTRKTSHFTVAEHPQIMETLDRAKGELPFPVKLSLDRAGPHPG